MSEPATTGTSTLGAALAAESLEVGYGGTPVLHDLSLRLEPGKVTTVIGPNGCGKSTLLRTLARILAPTRGQVLLGDEPVAGLTPRTLARRLAFLPQSPIAPEGLTVADLTARGRQPHQPWYRQWSVEDDSIAQEAMRATGVLDLAERGLDQLSGGQRQRAWIAMALAQQTDVLLLDEPTTHLDLAHAVEVLDLVVRLRRETGRTIVLVLHDLSLAARFSDHLVVLDSGRIVTQGAPADVVTQELLREVFGLHAHVFPDPVAGLPTVVPAAHSGAPQR